MFGYTKWFFLLEFLWHQCLFRVVWHFLTKEKSMHRNKLTDARVATSDEHNLVGEVTTLQDVQSGRVSVEALWFDDHVLHREGLARVKVCCPLVNVAGKARRNITSITKHTADSITMTGKESSTIHLLYINDLALFISFLLPAVRQICRKRRHVRKTMISCSKKYFIFFFTKPICKTSAWETILLNGCKVKVSNLQHSASSSPSLGVPTVSSSHRGCQ